MIPRRALEARASSSPPEPDAIAVSQNELGKRTVKGASRRNAGTRPSLRRPASGGTKVSSTSTMELAPPIAAKGPVAHGPAKPVLHRPSCFVLDLQGPMKLMRADTPFGRRRAGGPPETIYAAEPWSARISVPTVTVNCRSQAAHPPQTRRAVLPRTAVIRSIAPQRGQTGP